MSAKDMKVSRHLAPYDNQMRAGRPLSPHLQIYKFSLTMFMSITHRVTGVGLVFGSILVMYWIGSAAYGPAAYETAQSFIGSWFGVLLLLGWSAALVYHLTCGIRWLLWDIGIGWDKEQASKNAMLQAGIFAVLLLIVWIAGFVAW